MGIARAKMAGGVLYRSRVLESFIGSTGISTVESHATAESHGRKYTLSESQVLEKAALIKESSTVNIRESELGKNTMLENIRLLRHQVLEKVLCSADQCERKLREVRTGGVQKESQR